MNIISKYSESTELLAFRSKTKHIFANETCDVGARLPFGKTSAASVFVGGLVFGPLSERAIRRRSFFLRCPVGKTEKVGKISPKQTENINFILREHQSNAHDWRFSNLAADLHIWAERMILYFKIQSQAIPALMVERLRKRPGHYRSGRNCFGINDEIAIDENHAQTCPYWHVLGTLAHEILHFWQQHNGNPPSVGRSNYHNKQYRQNAREIGLVVDPAGHTQYVQGDSPFIRLLKKYGVEFPPLLTFEGSLIRKCTSALRLYRCSCGINVRIGRPQFNARCLDCGTLFIEQKG